MGERINERPKGVNWNSSWPFTKMPEALKGKGDWILAMSITKGAVGLTAYYPAGEGAPRLTLDDGSLWGQGVTFRPFHRVASRELAHKFCVTFCSRGYNQLSALAHQDGTVWAFNWAVPTLATVRMASQVAERYFDDDYDGAWDLGRAFGREIREAENAMYEAAGSAR